MWASVFSTFENSVLISVNTWALSSTATQFVAYFCARYAIVLLFALPLVVIITDRNKTNRANDLRMLVRALLAVMIAWGVAFILESMVGRVRPAIAIPNQINALINLPGNSSFPSGHTVASFALAFSFFLSVRYRFLGVLMMLLAILVAFGRVAVGAHYPTDVLAGAAVGMLVAFLLAYEGSPLFRWLLKARSS